jgi:hypothetical protein
MITQIVENLESFSEAQLEALEFLPEELENIESELYPSLESISLEEVAKDLEAYFEGDIEQAGLETRLRRPPRLQDLPTELLLKIGTYLSPKHNRKFRVALRKYWTNPKTILPPQ